MNYPYIAYGLGIHSEVLLPELLVSAEAPFDVTIRSDSLAQFPMPSPEEWHHSFVTPDGTYLAWHGVGAFLVCEGREVIVYPADGVAPEMLRLPLLGSVLAILLFQRGLLVLHGSAVEINGKAVVFLGQSGAGKSTLVAALARQGYRLLADDVIAIRGLEIDGPPTGQPEVLRAFGRVKLWPDAVAALGDDPENLPRINAEVEKRSLTLPLAAQTALPLGTIYLLRLGEQPAIVPVQPQRAILDLIGNSFLGMFGRHLLAEREAQQFRQCSRLVQCTPVCELQRPCDLNLMPQIISLLKSEAPK